jgi:hypothetical protein
MDNATGEDAYDAVATTVSDTVGLVLRLLGEYAVTEVYDEPSLAEVPLEEEGALGSLAEEFRFEEVIFGSIIRNDDGNLEFRLSLYNREEEAVLFEPSAVAESIFAVFDAADEIAIALVSEMSDVRVGFGELVVELEGEEGVYRVYLNDTLIRNPETDLGNVLNGEYTLSITQDRLRGETVIYSEEITIIENRVTRVRFSIPPATEEEIAYLEAQAAELVSASEEPERLEEALAKLADFQALMLRAGDEPTLQEIGTEAIATATELTSEVLADIRAQADSLYYADNPDFEAALETYDRFVRLVAEPYTPRTTEPAMEVSNPSNVLALEEGYLVVSGTDSPRTLVRLTEDFERLHSQRVTVGDDDPVALAEGPDGRIYVSWPRAEAVYVYSPGLDLLEEIATPFDRQFGGVSGRAVAVSDTGDLYVIEGFQAIVYDPERERDGTIETALGEAISEQEEYPRYARFGPQGLLHVFEPRDDVIIVTDFLGRRVRSLTLEGIVTGSGFAIDTYGNYYTVESRRHRVLRFSPEGIRLGVIGEFGDRPGQFRTPQDVSVRPNGTIAVADTFGQMLQVLEVVIPPIQSTEVTAIGEQFRVRQGTARAAVQRMDIVEREIRPQRVVGGLTGSLIGAAATLGLSYAGGIFENSMYESYDSYQSLTDPEEITSAREETERQWLISRALVAGSVIGIGVTSTLLTNAILNASDFAVARRSAVRQLQAFDMDSAYETDPERWRSLRTTAAISGWTGVLPPLLGIGWFGVNQVLDLEALEPWYYPGLAVSVGIPPIFGHAHGGRFHFGLFMVGLVADGILAAAWSIDSNRDEAWQPQDLPGTSNEILNGVWRQAQTLAPFTLTLGSLAVRLAAGAYDAREGWVQTRDRNRYQAVRPIED